VSARLRRYALLLGLAAWTLAGAGRALAQAEPTPLPLYALPSAAAERASSGGSLALLPDGRTVVVVNPLNNSVTIAVPTQERIVAEVAVGRDPRAVAVTPDGALALVTNRLDNTLSLVDLRAATVVETLDLGGAGPAQVVVNERGLAYVALRESGEVVEVDIAARAVSRRIPAGDSPAGLALWGEFLYVTNFWPGTVRLIYLPQAQVIAVASLASEAALAGSLALDVTRGAAYAPFTSLNSANLAPLYDSLAYPRVARIDLRNLETSPESVALDSADRPVNLPLGAALDRFRQLLYIAHYGSSAVTVLDLATGVARAHVPVGNGPLGVILNHDNSLLYVHNMLDGTVSTLNTTSFEVVRVQVVAPLNIPADLLIGAQLFASANDPRMSTLNGISCATCHFDGLSDGRTWAGIDGGRNTPLLYGLAETAPYLWSGAWDELADVELKIRALQAGMGLASGDVAVPGDVHAGSADDLDALTAWLLRLQPPALPAAGSPETRARGAQIFEEQGCAACHSGPAATDQRAYEVGTGGVFDTPSLRWLSLSAPYFHDGRAASLRDVLEMPGLHRVAPALTPDELNALIDYLLSLPEG
jgi:YVTN family beta-propeller protein